MIIGTLEEGMIQPWRFLKISWLMSVLSTQTRIIRRSINLNRKLWKLTKSRCLLGARITFRGWKLQQINCRRSSQLLRRKMLRNANPRIWVSTRIRLHPLNCPYNKTTSLISTRQASAISVRITIVPKTNSLNTSMD
jgi:hypothetical protein